jgi:hypothetical protein
MADEKKSIFSKIVEAGEVTLDSYIAKAKTTAPEKNEPFERKGLVEVDFATEQQYGWKERRGLVGPGVLKNMARKDSMIMAIINTRINQVCAFSQPQKDKYSPGFKVHARKPADLSIEDKTKLADPFLDDDQYKALKYELEKKRAEEQMKQDKEVAKITEFILHCGTPPEEYDTTFKRIDFDRFVKLLVWDRLVYNYGAVEVIPTRDLESVARFYPVSAGTIRYVSKRSAERYKDIVESEQKRRADLDKKKVFNDKDNDYRYVQVVRGKVEAAWTEKELIFEPGNPTCDPEDMNYAPGELELLINLVTAHLFAEAHNRNFFTQGIGTKGILHIKGENISRAQLEAFKRQWFNQVVNTRNAFRPPIIGIADDVKWVELAQSNKDMEFDNWMHYLIRMACATYQIDPSEINFDISKVNTSTLNETSNETRLRSSRDKGLRPLLDYVENIVNRHILRQWNPKLADKYEFKFVGLESESRVQEVDRLQKEVAVYKTLNEARIEMGYPPIEDGDLVLNATFTQFKQQKMANEQAQEQGADQQGGDQGGEGDQDPNQGAIDEGAQGAQDPELDAMLKDLDNDLKDADTAKQKEEDQKAKDAEKAKAAKSDEAKKSQPTVIEYFVNTESSDEE